MRATGMSGCCAWITNTVMPVGGLIRPMVHITVTKMPNHTPSKPMPVTSGSVTDAATLLHTSQPTVSRELARLEQLTGLTLFERVRGRLRPTAEALQLVSVTVKLTDPFDALRKYGHQVFSP